MAHKNIKSEELDRSLTKDDYKDILEDIQHSAEVLLGAVTKLQGMFDLFDFQDDLIQDARYSESQKKTHNSMSRGKERYVSR